MYRDFSEKSKQNILNLVNGVENEKWCDFTDWVGDRWYDFESWIGTLSIKNYINNVNAYHKKVIDKNNTTKETVISIFNEIKSVDISHKNVLSGMRTKLQQWQNFIEELSEIVNPGNGLFNEEYINSRRSRDAVENILDSFEKLKELIKEILNGDTDHLADLLGIFCGNPEGAMGALVSKVLEALAGYNVAELGQMSSNNEDIQTKAQFLADLMENIAKHEDDESLALTGSVIGYLAALAGIIDSKDKSGLDVTSDFLKFMKSSIGIETGIYDYYLKTMSPQMAAMLGEKFGKGMAGLSAGASILGLAEEGVDVYKIFSDSDSSIYDKVGQFLKFGGKSFDAGGKVYIAQQATSKTLHFVTKTGNSTKVLNQILATDQSYATSAMVSKNISKVTTGTAIANVLLSTLGGGIKQYGVVSEDGVIDGTDVGSIGVYGSLSGLDTVANSLTLGLVDFDSETVAADLENDVDRFLEGDSWAANYVKDQDNNVVLRFGVSVGTGAYIIGENIVEGIADTASTVGSWISTGWNVVTNIF